MSIAGLNIEVREDIPDSVVMLISARKYRLEWGRDGIIIVWEPEEEWAKRCAVIYNVGKP